MEFERLALKDALMILRKTDYKSSTDEIKNVQLKSDNDCLTARMTDLETEVTVSIPAEKNDSDDFNAVVPVQDLYKLVRKGSSIDDPWSVESGSENIEIANRFSMSQAPSDDIPSLESVESYAEEMISFDADVLLTYLEKLNTMKSDDSSREYLKSICFDPSGHIVATDAHQMVKIEHDLDIDERIKLRGKSSDVLEYALNKIEPDGLVEIKANNEFFTVTAGSGSRGLSFTLTGKTVDEDFPEWEQVWPDTPEVQFTFQLDELLSEVKTVSSVIDDKQKRLELTGNTLSSSNSQSSSYNYDLDSFPNNDDIVTAFNADIMLDVLKIVDDENPTFKYISPGAPIIIDGDDSYIIMPLRSE